MAERRALSSHTQRTIIWRSRAERFLYGAKSLLVLYSEISVDGNTDVFAFFSPFSQLYGG
jgi:hypothetical protein